MFFLKMDLFNIFGFFLNFKRTIELVVHHYALDVFMINFPVPEMPSVLCIKHAINLTELQKRYDMALKVFWK